MERLTEFWKEMGIYVADVFEDETNDNGYFPLSEDKVNVLINKLAYYEDLEEQGRLIVLSVKDMHPCRNCDTGWGSLSSDGTSKSCHDTCERLKEYNEKYNK